MRRVFKYLMLAFPIALFMSSCKGDEEPASAIPQEAVYDFVTFAESSAEGSVFTMRRNGDSPLISYYSDIDLSHTQSVSKGDRMILCYGRIDGEVYTSGKINVYGYGLLSSTEQSILSGSSADYNEWKCPPMKLNSMWRTGQYINIDTQITLFKAERPATFVLVADSATSESEYPALHIYYENAEDNDGANLYRVYASFDISRVWEKPSCRGVTVYYPTADGSSSIIFEK